MIYLNARLRLVTTKRIKTKDGKPMTTGFGYADIQGEMGFPLGLVCWNDMAEELARADYRWHPGQKAHTYTSIGELPPLATLHTQKRNLIFYQTQASYQLATNTTKGNAT